MILLKINEIEEEILENEKLYEDKATDEKEYIRKQLKLLDELNIYHHKLEHSHLEICKSIVRWFKKKFNRRKQIQKNNPDKYGLHPKS